MDSTFCRWIFACFVKEKWTVTIVVIRHRWNSNLKQLYNKNQRSNQFRINEDNKLSFLNVPTEFWPKTQIWIIRQYFGLVKITFIRISCCSRYSRFIWNSKEPNYLHVSSNSALTHTFTLETECSFGDLWAFNPPCPWISAIILNGWRATVNSTPTISSHFSCKVDINIRL